jgi:MtN3 and saliva related transmembrane protein
MELNEIIGYVAAVCTTISFLPQAIQIFKTRDTSSISLAMYSLFTFGVAAWLTFGIMRSDWPIIIANGITLVLASLILFYKIRYK